MLRLALAICAIGLCLSATLRAGDIGFAEEFALSKNRTEALKKLIPGTEDYYYYHALHHLNNGETGKAAALFKPWGERFPKSVGLMELQTRHALLNYEKDPRQSLDFFKERLGLRFDHHNVAPGAALDLPTTLDSNVLSREALTKIALAQWAKGTDTFEDAALDWLLTEQTEPSLRRRLLMRLNRPDIPNLAKIITADLNFDIITFGALKIQQQLTLAQMEEIAQLKPAMLQDANFVKAWLTKLCPGDDENWRHDPARTKAYLDRLLAFTRRLPASFSALKIHALYHRLAFDRSRGIHDKSLFIEYLKLPRDVIYMPKSVRNDEVHRQRVDWHHTDEKATMLPAVDADEELVRFYLQRFLVDAPTDKEFESFIDEAYLKPLFAETKIESGQGEAEQWATRLTPQRFRQLKDRVDIDFAPTNKTAFGVDEPVKLDLFIKNVPTLIVKVFEINARNYFRAKRSEVDASIDLDDLVANTEQMHSYAEPPFRRVGRTFEFPQLNKPGVYVIDFIGSGKSSRAMIRKGQLRYLESASTAGQKLTIVDEAGRPVPAATVQLGTQEYKADDNGVVITPFAAWPSSRPMVIAKGDFACLHFFFQQTESYTFSAGIHVDREALLSGRTASIVVRPNLYLNGNPVSTKLLEDVRLTLTATDCDGIITTTQTRDFKLFEDRDSVHAFRVPERLLWLQVNVEAKVMSLSQGKPVELSDRNGFRLNGILRTDKIDDLHFAKFGDDYVIEVLGRTGEPRGERPVQLELRHRHFTEPVRVLLKSDARGRVTLGPLADIEALVATTREGVKYSWKLPPNQHSYSHTIHAKAGEPIVVPYLGSAPKPLREELALFEMRGETIHSDRFDALTIKDGAIQIVGLAAGDYRLDLKDRHESIQLCVTDGAAHAGYLLGEQRHLQQPLVKPVQIAGVAADDDAVTIRLRDVTPQTRLHVYATRYVPEYQAFADLARRRDDGLLAYTPSTPESVYLTGRNIGDEYRYILDRRLQKKFPGNMLERPSLLLNPWAVRLAEMGEQKAAEPDLIGKTGRNDEKLLRSGGGLDGSERPNFPHLDFLRDASAVLLNLKPDKDGVVKIARKALGAHGLIHIVAIDPLHTTTRWLSLPEPKAAVLDLRLRDGLDPAGHFIQQRQATMLKPGQPLVLADARFSRFETYDSLAKAYSLFTTLSNDNKLAEFAFVLDWPKLKAAEKQTLYSKYACHELNFFIARKDAEFFKSVVKPYLANKKDKTFLDDWLLDNDLRKYLQPWHYAQLNAVERILLGQRIAGEAAKTARHLTDQWRRQPFDLERRQTLDETTLRAGGLNWSIAKKREKTDHTPLQPAPTTTRDEPKKPDLTNLDLGLDSDLLDRAADVDWGGFSAAEEAIFFNDDRKAKGAPARFYRRIEPTFEFAENNYFELPIAQQTAALVAVNNFWLDYARHDGAAPFLSRHLAEASSNFTEMMFALSVLDLPFAPARHEVRREGGKIVFTPGSVALVFHEEMKPVAAPTAKLPILVSQNFYRSGERSIEVDGDAIDRFITDEFVVNTVYGCQVVVTNPTSSRQRLAALIQVPVEALPLVNARTQKTGSREWYHVVWTPEPGRADPNGHETRTVWLDLEPYRMQVIEYQFYFPRAGKYAHFPVQVAKGDSLVAAVAPFTFNVVDKPARSDGESWSDISQNGTPEQLLAFLGRANLDGLDLDKIAFRMKDRAFFDAVLALLHERHAWNDALWSYSLFHDVTPRAAEYLAHQESIVNECGGSIDSSLLAIDPVARRLYEHLEYRPLANARAHAFGKARQIVNPRLFEQYQRFLKMISCRARLNDDDRLTATYYLLVQDRVEEAQLSFSEVDQAKVATRMQYDYCAAYLDMFNNEPKKVRALAAAYVNHPVDRWRKTFAAVAQQLDEMDGKVVKAVDNNDPAQQHARLAASEASFDFTVAARTINLTWKNVETVRINYYLMDVEMLFSRGPFAQQAGQFSMIRPNETKELKLPNFQNKQAIPMPDSLLDKNVLVEVVANGKTRTQPVLANAMNVALSENYGQLQVTDAVNGKPLAKVYVKAYVRLENGVVKFHRDGYTDHRGKFDYATVSAPDRAAIDKFAILVLSETQGAVIREAAPPPE